MDRNFTYENQGTHTYLVYAVAEDDAVDSMSLGMLTNNKIHGLAHTVFTQMDANKYIRYDVSAKISVKQFFSGQVNKKRLIGVFNGIVDAMLSAEDYMLDVNSIILDLDYIFADVSTCETVLICLPVVSDDLSITDLGAFFKNIMFTTQFDQNESCEHVAKIINYLNSSPIFSLEEFRKLLNELSGTASVQAQPVQTPVQQPVQQQPVQQQPVQQTVQQPVQQQPVQQPVQQQPVHKTPVQPAQPRPVVPPTPVVPSNNTKKPASQASADQSAEEKISWFYLMQHYNSENAAKYKAQKEAKKNGNQAKPTTPAPSVQQKKPPVQPGYPIPGQSTPVQQVPSKTPAQQSPTQQSVQQKTPAQQPVINNQPAYTPPQMPQGQPMNFGETTVLGGGSMGETTVLGATPAAQAKPCLIRAKNNERIDLNKPVFRIGKEKSYVDYFIGDNSAISRSHANIVTREGEYFVVDTNSTNHTYVNGQMLQSNVEMKIAHGAKIRLANEDFEFRLY